MVFFRKYRPQNFSDLFGQKEIADTLLSQLTNGKVGQGYLFWGPKGTGKTSTARILAKSVNCEVYKKEGNKFGEPCNKCANCIAISQGSFIDLVEIDAASNRGIDEIRDLREKVKLAPVVGKYKVYIIDEVHMLTAEAFNALLKTLEEPPKHVIFILATTEYSKLPATITSRLMKFNFKRADRESVFEALSNVAKQEKLKIGKEALLSICEVSEGSFRDAISILDQVSSKDGEISPEDVHSIARLERYDRSVKLVEFVANGKLKEAVQLVNEVGERGMDVSNFVSQTILLLSQMLYTKIGFSEVEIEFGGVTADRIVDLSSKFETNRIQNLMRLLLSAESEIGLYPVSHIPVVLAICKFCEDAEVVASPRVYEMNEEAKPVAKESEQVAKKEVDDVAPVGSKRLPLGEVEKKWEEFLNRVRPVNAHVFALLRATKPAIFTGESVVLEVFYRFHKDKLEEPKILKMLDLQMQETLGKKVRLKFMLAKRESRPTATVVKSDVVESRVSELEELAQEIFAK